MGKLRWVAVAILSTAYGIFLITPGETVLPEPPVRTLSTGLFFLIIGAGSFLIAGDIIRNDSKIYDEILSSLQYNELENRVLYWGVLFGILPVVFIDIYFPQIQLFWGVQNNIASTVGQVLATVFAIVISFSLLSIEFFSNEVTPRIINDIIDSAIVKITILLYIVAIPFLFYSQSLLSPQINTKISLIALTWGISFLLSYILFIVNRIQPTGQLKLVEGQIPNDFEFTIIGKMETGRITIEDQDDRYIDIQNTAAKLAQQGNIFAYAQWVNVLYRKETQYLSDLHQPELEDREEVASNYNDLEAISSYFTFIHRHLINRVIMTNNSALLRPYLSLYLDRVNYTAEIKLSSQFSVVVRQLRRIMRPFLQSTENLQAHSPIFTNFFEDIAKKAVDANLYVPLLPEDPSPQDRLWGMEFRSEFRSLLDILCENVGEESFEGSDMAEFCADILSSMLMSVFEHEGRIEVRKEILFLLLEYSNRVYDLRSEKGHLPSYTGLSKILIQYSLTQKTMSEEQISLAIDIIEQYGEWVLLHINKEDDETIQDVVRFDFEDIEQLDSRILEQITSVLIDCIEESDSPDTFLQTLSSVLDSHRSSLKSSTVERVDQILENNNI